MSEISAVMLGQIKEKEDRRSKDGTETDKCK